jgi:hypothetical protein
LQARSGLAAERPAARGIVERRVRAGRGADPDVFGAMLAATALWPTGTIRPRQPCSSPAGAIPIPRSAAARIGLGACVRGLMNRGDAARTAAASRGSKRSDSIPPRGRSCARASRSG